MVFDNCRMNRSQICLKALNIKSEIWRRSLSSLQFQIEKTVTESIFEEIISYLLAALTKHRLLNYLTYVVYSSVYASKKFNKNLTKVLKMYVKKSSRQLFRFGNDVFMIFMSIYLFFVMFTCWLCNSGSYKFVFRERKASFNFFSPHFVKSQDSSFG